MGRTFRAASRKAGFTLTRNVRTADVIFAHSGGCLLLPAEVSAHVIVLVGLAFWPGQSWLTATKRHLASENAAMRAHRTYIAWLLKWLVRGVYIWRIDRTIKMGRNQNLHAAWNSNKQQIFIRNKEDAYLTPDIASYDFKGPRTFISLPGSHDDCWDNPQPYINLIQSVM